MIKFLIPLIVALEIADGVLTHSAVGNALVQEANPLFRNTAGSGSFLIMKISGALLSALLLWLIYQRFPKVSLITSAGIMLFYTAVYTWNLSILFRSSPV
jgi:hypothetical protein